MGQTYGKTVCHICGKRVTTCGLGYGAHMAGHVQTGLITDPELVSKYKRRYFTGPRKRTRSVKFMDPVTPSKRDAWGKHQACGVAAKVLRWSLDNDVVQDYTTDLTPQEAERVTAHLTDLIQELERRAVTTPRQTHPRRAKETTHVDEKAD